MKRLGWIKPDDGVRIDGRYLDYECYDLNEWLKVHGVTGLEVVVETSVAEGHHAKDDLLATGAIERLLRPARRLADSGCDAMAWVCTSGSFIGGLAWAEAQVDALQAATGLPATSTSLALTEAANSLGADMVDVLSPYPEPVSAALHAFFEECRIPIANERSLGCLTGSASHALDLRREVGRFAEAHPDSSHPLVIADAAINTLDLVATLEADLGRPVVTANQATLWRGLGLLGLPRRALAAGALLAGEGVPTQLAT